MQTQEKNFLDIPQTTAGMKRREFLKYGGIGVAAALVVASSCKKDSSSGSATNPKNGAKVTLEGGDVGILQYAYALEQLESAFYTKVIQGSYYSSAPANERAVLSDIQQHELCHVDLFKTALGGLGKSIIDLTPFFNNINFGDRNSVLTTAKTFEDLGVSAYNGAGKYVDNLAYLTLAGKIVSVEARHAAAIRDLLNPNSADFSGDDVIDASSGLDKANKATYVFSQAGNYVTNTFDFSALPNI